jgi:hypothetical protein
LSCHKLNGPAFAQSFAAQVCDAKLKFRSRSITATDCVDYADTFAHQVMHVYEVRPRKDKRGVDLISDALPFSRLWHLKVSDAIGYAEHYSRSHDGVISRVTKWSGFLTFSAFFYSFSGF